MQKIMPKLIFGALMVLALSLFTSISLMAGFHILIIIPIVYFARSFDWKEFPASAWMLCLFSLVLIISVIANQDVIGNGFKNALKVKYFLIGALSFIPLNIYFNRMITGEKRDQVIKIIIATFLLSACLATLSGLIGYYTGFNPLKMREVTMKRSGGMFGMLMTYSHSVALLCSLIMAAIYHRKNLSKWVDTKLLAASFFISYIGLFTTYTRGAMIAFLISIFFYSRKYFFIMTAITVLLYAGMSKFSTSDKIESNFVTSHVIRQDSNDQRKGSWEGAFAAFQERPFLGYGFLNFEPHSREIKARNKINSDFHGHAHNNFLEVLATAGVFGIATFVMWLLLWSKEVYSLQPVYRTIIFAFITCFFVGGLTQVTLNDGENAFFIMAIYSLSLIAPNRRDNELI